MARYDHKLNTNLVKKRLKKINLTLLTDYKTSHENIKYKCDLCNFTDSSKAYDVWNRGCLNCRIIKTKENIKNKQIIKHGTLNDHPYLLKEYHSSNSLDPKLIPNNYRKKIKWKCSICNYIWKAALRIRLQPNDIKKKYRNCPKCGHKVTGKKVAIYRVKKFGSLKKKHPEILKEWDYNKNTIKPENISPYSGKKVWWICKKKHSWPAVIGNRTLNDTGCPDCNNFKTSRAEIRIYSELISFIDDVRWSYYFKKRQLDIYLPKLKLAFEVDGHYHKEKDLIDKKKNIFFKKNGISIIRLRDFKLNTKISPIDFFINTGDIKIKDLHKIYKILIKKKLSKKEKTNLKKRIKVNKFLNDKEYRRICSFLPGPPPEKSIAILYPKISKEWETNKNFPLLPSMFTKGSNAKVWWKCLKCKNLYQQAIYNRCGPAKQGCRPCSNIQGGKRRRLTILKKVGSVNEKFPDLAKQFLKKYNQVKLKDIPITSPLRVWWYCKIHKHKWQASVYDRAVAKKHNCKLCYMKDVNKIIRLSHFDIKKALYIKYPNIFKHLDKNLNKDHNLKTFTYGSKYKLWFKCKNNHVFQSQPNTQTTNKIDKLKCRKCSFMNLHK